MAKVLGIDYGQRRIGVAVSDPLGIVAMPLRVVDVTSEKGACRDILACCAETEAELVVVGLPVNMDGTLGPMANKAQAFAERLARRLNIPVRTWDERLSTCMAERILLEADLSRKKRKQVRDKVAAQVILQGFLDRCGE